MTSVNTFFKASEIKPKDNYEGELDTLNMRDIRRLIKLKYAFNADFGRKVGWGKVAVCRFLTGDWIPQNPKVIQRVADELGINVVKLSRMLERSMINGDFVSADKYSVATKLQGDPSPVKNRGNGSNIKEVQNGE